MFLHVEVMGPILGLLQDFVGTMTKKLVEYYPEVVGMTSVFDKGSRVFFVYIQRRRVSCHRDSIETIRDHDVLGA